MSSVENEVAVKDNGRVSFVYPQLRSTNYTTWPIKVEAIMEARGVAQKKTVREVWDSLKTRFVGADNVKAARLQTLKNEFDGLRMSEWETLEKYAAKLSAMSAKYASLGATLNDADMVKKLFDTMPTQCYTPLVVLKHSRRLYGRQHLAEIAAINYFLPRYWKGRQKYKGGKEKDTSEGIGNRGRGGCSRRRGRGRGEHTDITRRENKNGSRGGGREKSHIRCYNCNKGEDGPGDDTWYFNNGASNHMTGDRKHFHDLDESVQGEVKFGDGSKVQIKGKGFVLFEFKGSEQRLLDEVMEGEYLWIYDSSGILIMKVKCHSNRLYKATITSCAPVCLMANISDHGWSWHARLGNVTFKALRKQKKKKKKMVIGVPLMTRPNQLCQGCLIAKQP
ncbi:uncharacterized protein LOC127259122 [Andrographis paniculata]|uniref:uncharacterized protein LOC127259122 n=1 Tax=Andrographis paniculata TaxID=175694 RepID=UPI0021E8E778|nr:uncharacterized protein LOC127259122 [Andrographis paniculata]